MADGPRASSSFPGRHRSPEDQPIPWVRKGRKRRQAEKTEKRVWTENWAVERSESEHWEFRIFDEKWFWMISSTRPSVHPSFFPSLPPMSTRMGGPAGWVCSKTRGKAENKGVTGVDVTKRQEDTALDRSTGRRALRTRGWADCGKHLPTDSCRPDHRIKPLSLPLGRGIILRAGFRLARLLLRCTGLGSRQIPL